MEEIKTQAIVLSCTDHKDADKRLALFSLEFGLVHATIKGVKKPKAKLASFAQPFCFAEYVLSKKGDFFTVINASSIENFFSVTADFDKFIIGSCMLEFCKKSVKENDPAPGLFVLLLKSLKSLDMTQANPMAVLIRFLIDGMEQIGYKLVLDKCASCGKDNMLSYGFNYSFDQGGIICKVCNKNQDALELDQSEQGIIKNIAVTSIDQIDKLKFYNRNALVSAISLFAKQYRLYTGEELKTLAEYLV